MSRFSAPVTQAVRVPRQGGGARLRIAYDKTKQANSRRVPGKMEERNNNSGSGSDVAYQEVVRILKLKKSWSRRAEMIVAVMSGYEDIVGRAQDAGKDKPFDLRAHRTMPSASMSRLRKTAS